MFRNSLKTSILLAGLGGFLVLIGSLFGRAGTLIGLTLGVLIAGGSYWFSDKLAIRAARARPLEPGELPWLQADVAALAARGSMPTPRVFLSLDSQPNAFATGRNEKSAVVCVTAGLVEVLDRDEVRGVLAHELAHIRNRDILIASIAAAIATGISALANMAMFAGMFGGGGDDEDRPNPFAMLLLALVAPIAAGLLQMALSRSREFEADRRGAELLGDPAPLARALAKIDTMARRTPMDVQPSQASAWIINPLTGRQMSFARLFTTHPSTEERIARLVGDRHPDRDQRALR
jgi:heat shock protein HtpX